MVQFAFRHEAPRAVLDALLDANGALVGPALWRNDPVDGRLVHALYAAHQHIFDEVCVPLRAFVDHCVDHRWLHLLRRPSRDFHVGHLVVQRLRSTLRTDEDVAFLPSMDGWHLSVEINAHIFTDCVRLYMEPPHEISLGCLSSILDHGATTPMFREYRYRAGRPAQTLLSCVLSQVPEPSSDRFADLVRMIAQHRKIVFEAIDEDCLFLLVKRYAEFRDKRVLVRLFNFMIDCGASVHNVLFGQWLNENAHM
jgi:hypothetical protein